MKVVIIWIIGSEKTWWSINQWDEKDNQLYVYVLWYGCMQNINTLW